MTDELCGWESILTGKKCSHPKGHTTEHLFRRLPSPTPPTETQELCGQCTTWRAHSRCIPCGLPKGHSGKCKPVAAPTERVETSPLLDSMVRDFTELGRCSKSEVRRRIQEYALAVAAVAPSPAPASQAIVHEGFSTHRLRSNPLEQAYFDAWREQATHTLGWLLQDSSNNHFPEDYSARDAKVSATIIQWLGSPVGRCFVNEVLEKAGKL